MNTSMNATIRRLTMTFITLLIVISGITAYIQIGNQAFFNGPVLAHGDFDKRVCPPYDAPVRGTIFDRSGKKLAWSEQDDNAPCGYVRKYADATLSPLIGYYSPQFGTAGLEKTYNDALNGVNTGESLQDVQDRLLYRPRHGKDIYLTVDEDLQQAANKNYDASAIYNARANGACQPGGTSPPGAMVVQDPKSGEILAMVSRPYYDPNRIDEKGYFDSLKTAPGNPLINHATQSFYTPGSTFKTVTLIAALDSGKSSLEDTYTKDEATKYTINGFNIRWVDYLDLGQWQGIPFPITVRQAYAYSDNTAFAREAVKVGRDTWLDYVRRFGIATPGTDSDPLGFDGEQNQSRAYNAQVDGKDNTFPQELLATSGFGQGQLQMSPLTMASISAAVANDGILYEPHAVRKVVTFGTNPDDVLPIASRMHTGGPIFRPETAKAVRDAMWAVTKTGTGAYVTSPTTGQRLSQSSVKEGGKTGTAEHSDGLPDTWWISLAQDDAAPGGSAAKLSMAVMKERSGEGSCQVFVADDTYKFAFDHNIPAPDK